MPAVLGLLSSSGAADGVLVAVLTGAAEVGAALDGFTEELTGSSY
jgi:hypothetical protein